MGSTDGGHDLGFIGDNSPASTSQRPCRREEEGHLWWKRTPWMEGRIRCVFGRFGSDYHVKGK
jgi:hypothetical protein